MNGALKITERIISDAKLQGEEVISKAKLEASEIIKLATESVEILTKKTIEDAEKESLLLVERAKGNAILEANKEKLKVKQNLIDEVFNKALEEICNKPDNEYEKILIQMIADMAETGNEEICLNKNDKNRVCKDFVFNINMAIKSKGLPANMKLSHEDVFIKGGAVLKNGDVELNGSFETIIKAEKDSIEPDIFKTLFN